MATANRGTRLTKLVGVLKKKFKPTATTERPLFESLLYACLLENSTHDAAAKALNQLETGYFDWNEVRVSTRAELAEALKGLNDPANAADRLKRSLQSVFESVYAFDLEPMKKQNLGQSVKQIGAYDGVTPFAVSYVTQNGLGGHSIALNEGALLAFHVFDLISDAELKKRVVPGLERAVPKNKGVEIGTVIHQLGVEVGRNPYSPTVKKLLLDIDPKCKERLPKRPPKPAPKPEPAPAPKQKKKAEKPAEAKPEKAAAKKAPAGKKAAPVKKAPAKKATGAKAAEAKKTAAKKKVKKKVVKKKTTKKATSKKKPAKKVTKKAAAAKKKAGKVKKKVKKKAAGKSRKPR